MSESKPLKERMKVVLVITLATFLGLGFVGAILGDPNSSRPMSDREHIEAGAAQIDAYCASNPDSC